MSFFPSVCFTPPRRDVKRAMAQDNRSKKNFNALLRRIRRQTFERSNQGKGNWDCSFVASLRRSHTCINTWRNESASFYFFDAFLRWRRRRCRTALCFRWTMMIRYFYLSSGASVFFAHERIINLRITGKKTEMNPRISNELIDAFEIGSSAMSIAKERRLVITLKIVITQM